jgi:hypothetical protein
MKNKKQLTEKKYRCLKRVNWDYNISAEDMFAVINGEKSHAGHWNEDDLLIRLLERLSWYDLLDFFSPDEMAQKLRPVLLKKTHNKEKRAKYERLGKILRKEPVSFTKWGAKYSAECLRDTLFSNRWYST